MPAIDGRTVSDKEFSAYVINQNQGLRATEYPKMLYRAGPLLDHDLSNVPLKIQGKHEAQTFLVNDADEELAAMAEGWVESPDQIPAKGKKEAA